MGKRTEEKCRNDGKYLGNRMDSLKWQPNRRVPLLINGNCLNLQPTIVNNRAGTVINACAFVRVCQSILIASTDFPHIEELVLREASAVDLFNVIEKIIQKGNRACRAGTGTFEKYLCI